MKKLILLIITFPFLLNGACKEIEHLFDQAHINQNFTGTVLVKSRGCTVLRKSYGMAVAEWDIPNSCDTKYPLASITKQFTAAAVLILAEEGKLGLHDFIGKYIDSANQSITIHHLLTHTSGISHEHTAGLITTNDLVFGFLSQPLLSIPGEEFHYSDGGYDILGYIIEKVSGSSYEDFITARIFEPLDMKESGYAKNSQVIKKLANGYAIEGNRYTHAEYLDYTSEFAAGALYSTVDDMEKWDTALHEGKILSEKSLSMMFTPHISFNSSNSDIQEMTGKYGYGFFIGSLYINDSQVITELPVEHFWHAGLLENGFKTHYSYFPDEETTLIVLSNNINQSEFEKLISQTLEELSR